MGGMMQQLQNMWSPDESEAATIERFTIKNGTAYDGGKPTTKDEIAYFLRRQQQAMENNKKAGELGIKANEYLIHEYNKAYEIYNLLNK